MEQNPQADIYNDTQLLTIASQSYSRTYGGTFAPTATFDITHHVRFSDACYMLISSPAHIAHPIHPSYFFFETYLRDDIEARELPRRGGVRRHRCHRDRADSALG